MIFRGFCIQMNWKWSGWQDSNLRPPAPKAGAIPGYATPRKYFFSVTQLIKELIPTLSALWSGEGGIRTHGTDFSVRQFSKLFLSASQAPHL